MATDSDSAAHILVVEDDAEIRNLMARFLTRAGYSVATGVTGADIVTSMQRRSADIVLLDLMLPQESGQELCQRIRATSNARIIMVTALADVRDRITGLNLGADDYVSKPFDLGELGARIRAVLRRNAIPPIRDKSGNHASERAFGTWTFFPERRALYNLNGIRMTLTGAETDLMLVFFEHAGQVLSRTRLVELLYGGQTAVEERTIDLLISRLRKKLADGGRQLELIRTVRGDGYIFDPDVPAKQMLRS